MLIYAQFFFRLEFQPLLHFGGYLQFLVALVPVANFLHLLALFFNFFIPLMGRFGAAVNPGNN